MSFTPDGVIDNLVVTSMKREDLVTGEVITDFFDASNTKISYGEYPYRLDSFSESDGTWPDSGIITLCYTVNNTNESTVDLSYEELLMSLVESSDGFSRSVPD